MKMENISYIVSCMYGTVNPFELELMEKKTGDEKYAIIDTYTYDSKKAGRLMTDEQYYEKLKSFIGDRKIKGVHMKNNAASFVECIRRHGEYSVSEFVEVAQGAFVMMEWISVADRLPEYGKEIIINNRYGVSVAYYVENGGGDYFCNGGCFILNSATHWMPLPEPPKEIEE